MQVHSKEPKVELANALTDHFIKIRERTNLICTPLETEDYVVQPVEFVSPPKWHLAHTTWFFETFLLKAFDAGYQEFHPQYSFLFNSYYEAVGERVIRTNRGNITRPSVKEIYAYRKYVDEALLNWLKQNELTGQQKTILETGFQHEQQHQELLITDIKYILGHNPLFPKYADGIVDEASSYKDSGWVSVPGGVYPIGNDGENFCFDNELGRHKVYVNDFSIAKNLVTQGEFLEFVENGGYQNFEYWHADGWSWVQENHITRPLYWHNLNGQWYRYSLNGLVKLEAHVPVLHLTYYEAAAFASYKGLRLPTEFEWEIASDQFNWGLRWEWTNSAYLPYPGFSKAPGALGEYNGKFMVNQMVLRGGSVATSPNHTRKTYRNFFQPNLNWQYTGIRLAK